MLVAKYKHPKMATKKVWVGMYGGHGDVIVFFTKKPKKNQYGEYSVIAPENKAVYFASMWLCEFLEVYPNVDLSQYLENGRPKDIEITEVFQMKIEVSIDDWGQGRTIDYNADKI